MKKSASTRRRNSHSILSKRYSASEMVLATPHRVWGSLDELARELKNIRKPLLQPYKFPLKGLGVNEHREKAIKKLAKAIDVAEQLASEAKMTSDKGMAGISEARLCHLLFEFFELRCDLRSLSKRHQIKSSKKVSNLSVIKGRISKICQIIFFKRHEERQSYADEDVILRFKPSVDPSIHGFSLFHPPF